MKLVGTDSVSCPDWVLVALREHEASLLRYAASLVGESRAQLGRAFGSLKATA
jgi:hypothetical protein